MRKNIMQITGALLIVLSMGYSQCTVEANSTCSTKEECNAVISEAQSQITALQSEVAAMQDEIEIVEGNMGETIQQIAKIEDSMAELESQIQKTENEILVNEQEVKKLEGEISELKEVVAERMRASQRLSRGNTILQVLSESDSLVEFIRRLRIINHFAENDSEAMDQLSLLVSQQQAIVATLKLQQQELAANKLELEEQQATLVAYQEKLEQQKEELAKQMQELESERLSNVEILEIAEAQKKLLEQTPPPAVSSGSSSSNTGSSSSSGTVTSTGFMIPLATGYVSCEFMCYSNHTGIDLANYGDTSTPVYAAQAGTVIRAGWHSAYGNHVMISHNIDGQILTTVYAHMHTAPYVSVGQQVSRGTQLGTMGNTGNSFGAHLHFEIYEGYYNYPYATNPRKYVNFPSSW